MERHACQNFRVIGRQLLVAFNRRILELIEENIAIDNKPLTDKPRDCGLNRGIFPPNLVKSGLTQQQYLRVLKTFNRKPTQLPQIETFKGRNELIFKEKLQGNVLAIAVVPESQGPLYDDKNFGRHIAFRQ